MAERIQARTPTLDNPISLRKHFRKMRLWPDEIEYRGATYRYEDVRKLYFDRRGIKLMPGGTRQDMELEFRINRVAEKLKFNSLGPVYLHSLTDKPSKKGRRFRVS